MKIRTDFVTNSSSSSFVVDITVIDKDGNDYTVAIHPDDGGGNGDADLNCKAKDIAKTSNIDELIKLLSDSLCINKGEGGFELYDKDLVEFDDDDLDDRSDEFEANLDDEEEDEFDDDEEYFEAQLKKALEYYRNRLSKYGEFLKKKEISNLEKIVLKRKWFAWGECASGFHADPDAFAEGITKLAKKVINSKGEEKEEAKKKFEKFLADFDGDIEAFPDGFLGSKVKGSIVWNKFSDSLEELAQKLISGDLPDRDYAESTTTIDLQKKKVISQKSEYILRKDEDDESDNKGIESGLSQKDKKEILDFYKINPHLRSSDIAYILGYEGFEEEIRQVIGEE